LSLYGWHIEKEDPHATANMPKGPVFRHGRISDLSVPIARASCNQGVVAALDQYAGTLQGNANSSVKETAGYLRHLTNAYYACLLNSKFRLDKIAGDDGKLNKVKDLYLYYNNWITILETEGEPVLAFKGIKAGILYQSAQAASLVDRHSQLPLTAVSRACAGTVGTLT